MFLFLIVRPPPRTTRTYTLLPSTPPVRSVDDGRLAVRPASRTRDCQQTADDGLHAGTHRRFRKGHGAVKAVPVGDRTGGKTELARVLGKHLRVDRAFQHGV